MSVTWLVSHVLMWPYVASPAVASSHRGSGAPVVLLMTVEIGDGRAGHIEMREADDPEEVARAFVAVHGLEDGVTGPLAQHIRDNLAAATRANSRSSTYSRDSAPPPAEAAPRKTKVTKKAKSAAPKKKVAAGRAPERTPFGSSAANRQSSAVSARPGSAPSLAARGVHNRLYALAEVTRARRQAAANAKAAAEERELQREREQNKMTEASQQMMAGRTAGEFGNYGERLYVEGVLQAQARKRRAELAAEEKRRAEEAELRSKPLISEHARAIRRFGDENVAQRLASTARLSHAQARRLEQLRREKEAAEVADCTFKPKLSQRSREIMRQRTDMLKAAQATTHDQLYQDAERRRMRYEEYASWFPEDVTFRPNLSSKDQGRAASGGERNGGEHDEEITPVEDRLLQAGRVHEERLGALSKVAKGPVDEAMGMTDHSREVIAASRKRRFKQIFKCLDTSGAGMVDLATADLDSLDAEVREDVEEVATALAEAGTGSALREEAFVELMTVVTDEPGRAPRQYLAPSQRSVQVHKPSFKPRISERSRQLAARRRVPGQPVHEALMAEQKARERALSALKRKQQELERQACTFKPEKLAKESASLRRSLELRAVLPSAASALTVAMAADAKPAPAETRSFEDMERELHAALGSETGALASAAAQSTAKVQPVEAEGGALEALQRELETAGVEDVPVDE